MTEDSAPRADETGPDELGSDSGGSDQPRADHRDELVYHQVRSGWQLVDLRELWRYRGLFWTLSLRDIQVQYRQTVIGISWAVIRPLTLMVIFTMLFRLLGRIPAANTETYAISLYAGLLPWQLFSTTLSRSATSLVTNEPILTKVYFPRLILPAVPLVVGLLDFVIAFLVLVGMMAWFDVAPTMRMLGIPLFVAMTLLVSFSLGTWLSAANALYRDIQHAVPFLIQVGMYVSPVIYEMRETIPERWQTLYCLNPMVGVLEAFRWALLADQPFPLRSVILSLAVATAIMLGGLVYFRRIETFVADRV